MNGVTHLGRAFSTFALMVVFAVLGTELLIRTTTLPAIAGDGAVSQIVTAREGEILWAFTNQDGKWRLKAAANDVDAKYVEFLLAYEDKRFWRHHGVDVLALLRATYQMVVHGRVISGGSTLTMQLARILDRQPRTFASKLTEIFVALKLERLLSKREILDLYLQRASFGGNIEGVRAASLIYFGKEPRKFTLSEAALLVSLPQSPEARRPDRHLLTARSARNRVLAMLASGGEVDARSAAIAIAEPLSSKVYSLQKSAPHLAFRLRAVSNKPLIRTLIDARLQSRLEAIVKRVIEHWGSRVNISVIVYRNRDGSVAAYLGGADLNSYDRGGFIDLVRAVRSPGSALKPFIYAMAFEQLIVHPDTIITDRPIDEDGYHPENSDGLYSGDISAREALIRSRNTPAVMLLKSIGVNAFLARFRSTGKPLVFNDPNMQTGLAVALGGVGITLEQITWFYMALANGGELHAVRFVPEDSTTLLGRLFTRSAALATASILSDVPPPRDFARKLTSDGGRRVGFKTGTSFGFRDAWAIGFDRLHTVGVWVGRPDGAAHLGAYGATAAAPVLYEIFDSLPVPEHEVSEGDQELELLAPTTSLPTRLIRFKSRDGVDDRLRIVFPRDGATVHSGLPDGQSMDVPLSVRGGVPPYRWIWANEPQPPVDSTDSKWPVARRGQFEVRVIDSSGAIAKSSFWLE